MSCSRPILKEADLKTALKSALDSDGVLVALFFSESCPHCHTFCQSIWNPSIKMGLPDESLHFKAIDCSSHADVCREYEIQQYPTLLSWYGQEDPQPFPQELGFEDFCKECLVQQNSKVGTLRRFSLCRKEEDPTHEALIRNCPTSEIPPSQNGQYFAPQTRREEARLTALLSVHPEAFTPDADPKALAKWGHLLSLWRPKVFSPEGQPWEPLPGAEELEDQLVVCKNRLEYCGFWQLFHTMAEDLPAKHSEELMVGIRDYVDTQFKCNECREHFLRAYNRCDYGRCDLELNPPTRVKRWLFALHNGVTERISGSKKKRFPYASLCPACYQPPHFRQLDWAEIDKFLRQTYGEPQTLWTAQPFLGTIQGFGGVTLFIFVFLIFKAIRQKSSSASRPE